MLIYTPGWGEAMWSKVSTLRTPLSEKLVHRVPSILIAFPCGSQVLIYTPGWGEAMWNKVSTLPTPLSEKLVHRALPVFC